MYIQQKHVQYNAIKETVLKLPLHHSQKNKSSPNGIISLILWRSDVTARVRTDVHLLFMRNDYLVLY